MSQANSKPSRMPAMVVVRETSSRSVDWIRLIPAAFLSAVVHTGLIALLFMLSSPSQAEPPQEQVLETPIQADNPEEPGKNDPFLTTDVDPAALDFDTDINFNVDRMDEVSVPGQVIPDAPVGILNGDQNAPPVNLNAPIGLGGGQGGGVVVPGMEGNAGIVGMAGGYNLRGAQLAGTFYGRSGATREKALRDGGGTGESEAAVTRGLKWLARTQLEDGSWKFEGGGRADDVAATAFGLLPFLGAGKTHKQSTDNPYFKPVEKALAYLRRRQDQKTGGFGVGMYSHGLATIALCEAYGLSQDPNLRAPAQRAVNYIVNAQHSAGGWRYSPGQAGDTSVYGWQVMALKSAQMANLDVPESTMRKAIQFLDSVCDTNSEGYGYTGPGSTQTMSSVGLLCRQYLQSWGPQNIRMITGIEKHLLPKAPAKLTGGPNNMYFYYYATQVLHHFGGEAWKKWNEKMRERLVATQEKNEKSQDFGSWDPKGDSHSAGRLMTTSLSLLTLEVYYRHLPLYYREAGEGMMPAKP